MKRKLFFALSLFTTIVSAQSMVQSVNSGSIIGSNAMVSVGEITLDTTPTGSIGILAQLNEELLEVTQFEVSQSITAYPNPTSVTVYFQSSLDLSQESVTIYTTSGQMVFQQKMADNTLDLSRLASGQYLVVFQNKKFKSFQIIKK